MSRSLSIYLVLGALFAAMSASDANGQLRVRKNYRDLSPQERQDFVDAVKAVKAKAEVGTQGTCAYTNTYDKYVCWHRECGCQAGAQHRRPMFLAWHRELLRRFELDLGAVPGGKPGIAIPYWNSLTIYPTMMDLLSRLDLNRTTWTLR